MPQAWAGMKEGRKALGYLWAGRGPEARDKEKKEVEAIHVGWQEEVENYPGSMWSFWESRPGMWPWGRLLDIFPKKQQQTLDVPYTANFSTTKTLTCTGNSITGPSNWFLAEGLVLEVSTTVCVPGKTEHWRDAPALGVLSFRPWLGTLLSRHSFPDAHPDPHLPAIKVQRATCFHNSCCLTHHLLRWTGQAHREACRPGASAWFSLSGYAVTQRALMLALTLVLGPLMSAYSMQGADSARRPDPSHAGLLRGPACCQVHGHPGLTGRTLIPEPRPLPSVKAISMRCFSASTW